MTLTEISPHSDTVPGVDCSDADGSFFQCFFVLSSVFVPRFSVYNAIQNSSLTEMCRADGSDFSHKIIKSACSDLDNDESTAAHSWYTGSYSYYMRLEKGTRGIGALATEI